MNGVAATFTRDGQELIVITPRTGIRRGSTFRVAVDYAACPRSIVDPDQSIEGWVPTDDGAFVVNEPQGSPGWYPCNDNPRDKATFDFAVTVPQGLTAMANGVLVSIATSGGKTTWVWKETDPMATYLATATLGRFDLTISSTASGLPCTSPSTRSSRRARCSRSWPSPSSSTRRSTGPYPFNAVGAIVDSAKVVGYSLETQTKPNFPYVPDEATLVHELSHMWFGDSVTLTEWPDIWLHEGFATWSEWIWSEHQGNKTRRAVVQAALQHAREGHGVLEPAAGDPGTPEFLFNGTIYYRGGMTLQALREKVGDFTFFRIIRDWATQNRYGNVSTPQFIALAEQISGQDLTAFFDVWLYQEGKPTSW